MRESLLLCLFCMFCASFEFLHHMLQGFWYTALQYAACHEKTELCTLLLAHGADTAAEDSHVSTSFIMCKHAPHAWLCCTCSALMADPYTMHSRRVSLLCIPTALHALRHRPTHELGYHSTLCSALISRTNLRHCSTSASDPHMLYIHV